MWLLDVFFASLNYRCADSHNFYVECEHDRAVVAFMPEIFFHLVLKFGISGQYARFASSRFKSPLSEERLFGDKSHFSLQNHEIFSWLIGWLQFQREFPITKNKFMETAFNFLPSWNKLFFSGQNHLYFSFGLRLATKVKVSRSFCLSWLVWLAIFHSLC